MQRKKQNQIRANCGYCIKAGEFINYMAECSDPNVKYPKPRGLRVCQYFEVDMRKYNQK